MDANKVAYLALAIVAIIIGIIVIVYLIQDREVEIETPSVDMAVYGYYKFLEFASYY